MEAQNKNIHNQQDREKWHFLPNKKMDTITFFHLASACKNGEQLVSKTRQARTKYFTKYFTLKNDIASIAKVEIKNINKN